jgi:hypothetical protein
MPITDRKLFCVEWDHPRKTMHVLSESYEFCCECRKEFKDSWELDKQINSEESEILFVA